MLPAPTPSLTNLGSAFCYFLEVRPTVLKKKKKKWRETWQNIPSLRLLSLVPPPVTLTLSSFFLTEDTAASITIPRQVRRSVGWFWGLYLERGSGHVYTWLDAHRIVELMMLPSNFWGGGFCYIYIFLKMCAYILPWNVWLREACYGNLS